MATETSSIDDILLNSSAPQNPPPQGDMDDAPPEVSGVDEVPIDSNQFNNEPENDYDVNDSDDKDPEKETAKLENSDIDEYGNEKEKDNEVIRERLARQARKHEAEMAALRAQLTAQQTQQVTKAAEGFEYNPEAAGDWQQQLASFVEHTVANMTTKKQQEQQRQEEVQAQVEFENKFRDDVQRFPDFQEVITSLPAQIDDPMVYATRSMKNPAAFLYAAAKRAPQELQRISQMRDPYAKIAAMGALEASLRQTKPATKAPRPVGRTQEDSSLPHKTNKEPTIEDLIHRAEAKKRVQLNQRRGGR